MRIIVYWLLFALIWGPLVRLGIHDRGLYSSFWWASMVGHATFGALWVITCLDWRFNTWMMKEPTSVRCIRSLFLVAICWECLEWLHDTYFLVSGALPAQKGLFDTTSDVAVTLFMGLIVWHTRHTSRTWGLYAHAKEPTPAA